MRRLREWLRNVDWRLRASVVLVITAGVLVLAAAEAGLWQRPALVAAAAVILAAGFTAVAFKRTRNWLGRMDWRIAAILLATALAVAVTLVGFDLDLDGEQSGKFSHDVFAGWVASIAFFGSIGLIVAIVSLTQPEEERFENRARILFRGQDGRHIQYIVERIRETLEHYADDVLQTMSIIEYDRDEHKFRVRTESATTVRSYLDDIRTTYNSAISVEDVTEPPVGKPPNRLIYLRVGTGVSGSRPIVHGRLHEPIDTIIDPAGTCLVEYGMDFWLAAGSEPSTYAPVRYTQRLRLRLCNHLPDNQPVRIRLTCVGGPNAAECTLRPGEERTICEAADIRPGIVAYDFRILPLT